MRIIIPDNFIDPNPERGPWHDPVAERPGVFIYVQVLYANGTTATAVWTGNLWWYKGEVKPIGWRPLMESGSSL